jgi:hypothetical protein
VDERADTTNEQTLDADKPKLRRVQWVNWRDRGMKELHGDVGCRIHLTSAEGLTGKTLCGREFPADKGWYSPHKFCKRCVNKAYKMGFQQGFTKDLDSVPSKRD